MSTTTAPASPPSRPGLRAAWGNLDHRQRRVAAAAVLVLVTLALPWYSEDTVTQRGPGSIVRTGGSLSGLAGMSFIEAALLVVIVGVLALLWGRGTQRRFALPYPDGTLVCAAAGWMGALVVYRLFARPHGESSGQVETLVGLNWGIFVSLLAIGVLFAAGFDLRRHGPRNAVPGDPGPRPRDRYPAVDPETMVVRPRTADEQVNAVAREPVTDQQETRVVRDPRGADEQRTEVVPRPDQPTEVARRTAPDDQPTRAARPVRPDEQPTRAAAPAVPPAAADDAPEPLWMPTERRPRRPEAPPVQADGGEPPVHEWPSRMRRPERTPLPHEPGPARPADEGRRDKPDDRR